MANVTEKKQFEFDWYEENDDDILVTFRFSKEDFEEDLIGSGALDWQMSCGNELVEGTMTIEEYWKEVGKKEIAKDIKNYAIHTIKNSKP